MARIISERALVLERYDGARVDRYVFTPGNSHEVPDWVLQHPVYQMAVDEGSMHDTDAEPTLVPASNPDYDPAKDPSVETPYKKGSFPSRLNADGVLVQPAAVEPVVVPATQPRARQRATVPASAPAADGTGVILTDPTPVA